MLWLYIGSYVCKEIQYFCDIMLGFLKIMAKIYKFF